ncbi:hypothetical protein TorRG33x02_286990 [Trema orientale]|uniref:Uncharacterized protein n=1 Tax=Trema orientale TaxID=63057 RepID=A0A2P5CFE7_TREOI|nr:hypothetical protein TorRG33x02_286990 [Trema orientale]
MFSSPGHPSLHSSFISNQEHMYSQLVVGHGVFINWCLEKSKKKKKIITAPVASINLYESPILELIHEASLEFSSVLSCIAFRFFIRISDLIFADFYSILVIVKILNFFHYLGANTNCNC